MGTEEEQEARLHHREMAEDHARRSVRYATSDGSEAIAIALAGVTHALLALGMSGTVTEQEEESQG